MSVTYAFEPWEKIGPELTALGQVHFAEVDGGVEVGRPYELDADLIAMMDKAGALRTMGARESGVLIGYIMWFVQPDAESKGQIFAKMGPWFCVPGFFGVAFRVFKLSVDAIRRDDSVRFFYPHHRLNGRGANLGKFFRRMGAVEIEHTYSLRLES